VLAGVQDALAALQAALDTRVCVATGRALWDYVGKDLHLLVCSLQVCGRVCAVRGWCGGGALAHGWMDRLVALISLGRRE
jgi:hypothetical protein